MNHSRRRIYLVLILAALALAAGRIATAINQRADAAFLSANDRSRWCMIAALVETCSYSIDDYATDPTWQTIDKVRHRGRDGVMHYYSSKPPLYPTMIAGVTWMVVTATGMTLSDFPIYLVRIITVIVNLPQMFVMLLASLGAIENFFAARPNRGNFDDAGPQAKQDREQAKNWAGILLAIVLCFGTMLLPMAVTLNNHLPAAAATAIALWCLTRDEQKIGLGTMLLAGLSAGFAAANELPALSMLCLWGGVALLVDVRKTLLGFLPGVLIVAAAFFGTNYAAHDSWRPPYAHRGLGPALGDISIAEGAQSEMPPADEVRSLLQSTLTSSFDNEIDIVPSGIGGRWIVQARQTGELFAIETMVADKSNALESSVWRVHQWDDWYEYPGSYWRSGKLSGVDAGEESRRTYIFHSLIGHHGIFSLTPIFVLSLVGALVMLSLGRNDHRVVITCVLVASIVCFCFYMNRDKIDRNYGGVSCCFRWMLWFTPMWVWAAAPAALSAARNPLLRFCVSGLAALGIFSVATCLDSPWQHPWIYRYLEYLNY